MCIILISIISSLNLSFYRFHLRCLNLMDLMHLMNLMNLMLWVGLSCLHSLSFVLSFSFSLSPSFASFSFIFSLFQEGMHPQRSCCAS